MLFKNFFGLCITLCDVVLDFFINGGSGFFGIGLTAELRTKKTVIFCGIVDGTEFFTHAVLCNHGNNELSGTFNIV